MCISSLSTSCIDLFRRTKFGQISAHISCEHLPRDSIKTKYWDANNYPLCCQLQESRWRVTTCIVNHFRLAGCALQKWRPRAPKGQRRHLWFIAWNDRALPTSVFYGHPWNPTIAGHPLLQLVCNCLCTTLNQIPLGLPCLLFWHPLFKLSDWYWAAEKRGQWTVADGQTLGRIWSKK